MQVVNGHSLAEHKEHQLVFCTCPTLEVAQALAHAIVESKLAACANILPSLTSVFVWDGKIETAHEVLLMIKTTSHAYTALETFLILKHPYDCPEVIGIPIDHGYRGYLQWITETVSDSHLKSK